MVGTVASGNDCGLWPIIRWLSAAIAQKLYSLYLEVRFGWRGWLIDCRLRRRLRRRVRFIVSLDLIVMVHNSPAFTINLIAIARHCGKSLFPTRPLLPVSRWQSAKSLQLRVLTYGF